MNKYFKILTFDPVKVSGGEMMKLISFLKPEFSSKIVTIYFFMSWYEKRYGEKITSHTVRKWIREGFVDGIYLHKANPRNRYILFFTEKTKAHKKRSPYEGRTQ